MRKLIRPALFMAAKLGLFAAALTWFVGQICMTKIGTPIDERSPLRTDSTGWYLAWPEQRPRLDRWSVEVAENLDWAIIHFRYHLRHSDDSLILPGIAACWVAGRLDAVFIHHWLIVSAFILFYATLKFIYSRKPDGGEGDA